MYKLNYDWKHFEPLLRTEMRNLGATDAETKAILDGAWDAATEVTDVARYAADELELLREK